MARRAELLLLLPAILLLLLLSSTPALSVAAAGTIVFTTLGHSRYAFNVFALPLALASSLSIPTSPAPELRLTDVASVNYNGNFAPSSDALLFVSERNGSLNIYLCPAPPASSSRRVALQLEEGVADLLGDGLGWVGLERGEETYLKLSFELTFLYFDEANCINSTMPIEAVFASKVEKLKADQSKPSEEVTREPFECDHASIFCGYRMPRRN
ncbi:hypothetical protein ZWY2020_051490 [Hordeum vulgare]|nr:hypothetical protein ZWY2020_051490 [Hordeum vulgare]